MSGSTADREPQQSPGALSRAAHAASQLIGRNSTAFVGALLLLVGLGLLALVAKVLDLGNGAILVIAFLGPLLAYLILTGQLSEIGGGGVNVKFRVAARTPVEEATVRLVTEETQTIEKLGPDEMGRIAALDPEAPVVLTLTLGPRKGKYTFYALQGYMFELGRYPRFHFVVFLDHDGRAVGCLPREVLARQVQIETTVKPFLDAVNGGYLPHDPSIRTAFLRPNTTMEEALSRVTELQLDAMLVRDNERKLAGMVNRDDILARLVLAAARS